MRTIDPCILMDEWFGCLSHDRRIFWVGLILVADDQGRTLANPAALRAQIFPYDDAIQSADISHMLDGFETANKILRYTAGMNGNAKALVQIVNWWKYQKNASWMAASKYQAPDGWQDRCRYHTKGNEIISINWDKAGGFASQLPSPLLSPLDRREVEDDVNGEVNGDGKEAAAVAAAWKPASPAPDELDTVRKILNAATLGKSKVEEILSVVATRNNHKGAVSAVMSVLAHTHTKPGVKSPIGLATSMLLAGETIPECADPITWKVLPAPILAAAGINVDQLISQRMAERVQKTQAILAAKDITPAPPPPELRKVIKKLAEKKRIQ